MSLPHDQLPLPEYDHVPLGHLPARISFLDASQVQQLIEYETEHANRLPVQVVLKRRWEALQNGAEPSGQPPAGFAEIPKTSGTSSVSPHTTNAPAINPTSHGDPTNPS